MHQTSVAENFKASRDGRIGPATMCFSWILGNAEMCAPYAVRVSSVHRICMKFVFAGAWVRQSTFAGGRRNEAIHTIIATDAETHARTHTQTASCREAVNLPKKLTELQQERRPTLWLPTTTLRGIDRIQNLN